MNNILNLRPQNKQVEISEDTFNLFAGEKLKISLDEKQDKMSFLIDKLHITSHEITRIVGAANSGKTYLAHALSCCSILGLPWLDKYPINFDKNKKVLFIQLEGSKLMNKKRLKKIALALAEKYKLDKQDVINKINERCHFQFMDANQMAIRDLNRLDSYKTLMCQQLNKAEIGMVIIDNQSTLINTTDLNPNDPKARIVFDLIKNACAEIPYPIYPIILHHMNKAGKDAGTHQFKAAVGSEFNLIWDKKTGQRYLEHEKSNFETVQDIQIEFEDCGDYDKTIESFTGLFINSRSANFDKENELIINAVKSRAEDMISNSDLQLFKKTELIKYLMENTEVSQHKVTKALDGLIAIGELNMITGARNSKSITIGSFAPIKQENIK